MTTVSSIRAMGDGWWRDGCEKVLARILEGPVVPLVGRGLEADPETDRIDEFDH